MPELTFAAIESKVRDLAAERPDFEYHQGGHETCKYNPDDQQPGCLFGQAFIALGNPVPEEMDNRGITGLLMDLGISTSEDEEDWAGYVQSLQDRGVPWGEAVRKADAYAGGKALNN